MHHKEKINSITGLRGIACLFIVCYHYSCLFVGDRGLFDLFVFCVRVFLAGPFPVSSAMVLLRGQCGRADSSHVSREGDVRIFDRQAGGGHSELLIISVGGERGVKPQQPDDTCKRHIYERNICYHQ